MRKVFTQKVVENDLGTCVYSADGDLVYTDDTATEPTSDPRTYYDVRELDEDTENECNVERFDTQAEAEAFMSGYIYGNDEVEAL